MQIARRISGRNSQNIGSSTDLLNLSWIFPPPNESKSFNGNVLHKMSFDVDLIVCIIIAVQLAVVFHLHSNVAGNVVSFRY